MNPTKFAEIVANGSDKAIMMALIKIEEQGVNASACKNDVAKLLSHATTDVRCVAARAFIAIGGSSGIAEAMHILDDKEPRVRMAAAYAIARVGGKSIAYPFIRRMLTSEIRAERKAAESIVNYIDTDFSVDKPCAAELDHANTDGNAEFEEVELKDFAIKTGDLINVRMYKATNPDLEAKHQMVLSTIGAVDKRLLARIGKALASLNNEEDDDSPEDACTLQQVIIPPHGSGKDVYYFLLGDSDYDLEHGFVCLFKNKRDFCFVDFGLANNVNQYTQIETIAALFDDCSGG